MTVTIDDITTHTSTAVVLIRGSGFTAAEAFAMRTDMDTFLATPVPQALDDLDDVDTTTTAPVSGDALVYDGTEWAPGSVSGAISTVETWDGSTASGTVTDADHIRASQGLETYSVATPGLVYMRPLYGGTGSADLVARSDHNHTLDSVTRTSTAASGYMSSGTRTIGGSLNVTLLNGITYLVEGKVKGQMRGADVGPAYFRLSVTINGATYQSPAGSDGYWCVQGVPFPYVWEYTQSITGTGGTIPVSALVTYDSGAGFNVDWSELTVTLRPRR